MARRFYSDAEQALACEVIERYGGEVTKDALATIREALSAPKLNKSTVHRWWQAGSHTVATELQPAIKKEAATLASEKLDEMFEEVARRMLRHAIQPEAVADLDSKQAITAAAIAVDKMRLLRDMPTEIIKLWPGFMDAVEKLGTTPADVFNALIQQASALATQQQHYDDGDLP